MNIILILQKGDSLGQFCMQPFKIQRLTHRASGMVGGIMGVVKKHVINDIEHVWVHPNIIWSLPHSYIPSLPQSETKSLPPSPMIFPPSKGAGKLFITSLILICSKANMNPTREISSDGSYIHFLPGRRGSFSGKSLLTG